jgi:hypothetical protein
LQGPSFAPDAQFNLFGFNNRAAGLQRKVQLMMNVHLTSPPSSRRFRLLLGLAFRIHSPEPLRPLMAHKLCIE